MLSYQIRGLMPLPLKTQYSPNSQIWACDYDLQAGRRYFVSAASGKGKTTLQHLLYGLRRDYEGGASLAWAGQAPKDLAKLSPQDWADLRQKHLSVVFQDLRLFPELSVWDNLQLKNALTGHKTEAQMREMAEALGLSPFMDKPAGILSYGQKQRLAIIRALCQPFELLLLDEPFAHLDQDNIRRCQALIDAELQAQGAGMLLASLGEDYGWTYELRLGL